MIPVITILIIIAVLVFIALILIFTTGSTKNFYTNKKFYSLGTLNELTIYGKESKNAINEAIEKIATIENKMSVFKKDSELSKVNIHAGKSPEIVSKDTFFVIKKALEYCAISRGTFDITIRPIIDLWNIYKNISTIPSEDKIKENLKLLGV